MSSRARYEYVAKAQYWSTMYAAEENCVGIARAPLVDAESKLFLLMRTVSSLPAENRYFCRKRSPLHSQAHPQTGGGHETDPNNASSDCEELHLDCVTIYVLVATSRHQARSSDYYSRFADESLHEPQLFPETSVGLLRILSMQHTKRVRTKSHITLDVPTLPLRRHRRGASEASSFHASPTAQRPHKSRSPHPMRQHERARRRQHRRRHGPLVSRTDTSADPSSGPTSERRACRHAPPATPSSCPPMVVPAGGWEWKASAREDDVELSICLPWCTP